MILFGERSLRRALSEYVDHFHAERNHQGKGNVLLFPLATDRQREGPVQCRERLGGSYATIIVRRRDGPTARPIIWPHGAAFPVNSAMLADAGAVLSSLRRLHAAGWLTARQWSVFRQRYNAQQDFMSDLKLKKCFLVIF